MFGEDAGGDLEEGVFRERRVGGVCEAGDGLVVEGVARGADEENGCAR